MRILGAMTVAICTAFTAASMHAETAPAVAPAQVNEIKPKRVVPPAPGTKRFITIQIDPEEQRRALEVAAAKPFVPVRRPPVGDGASGKPSGPIWTDELFMVLECHLATYQ